MNQANIRSEILGCKPKLYNAFRQRVDLYLEEVDFYNQPFIDIIYETEILFDFLISTLEILGIECIYEDRIYRYKRDFLYVLLGNNFQGRDEIVINNSTFAIEFKAQKGQEFESRVMTIIHDLVWIIYEEFGCPERPKELFVLNDLYEARKKFVQTQQIVAQIF